MASAQRDFASMLNDLFVEPSFQDEEARAPISTTLDYLSVAEELHSGRIQVTEAMVAAQYLDAAAWLEAEAALAAPADPEAAVSIDPATIARELALDAATTLADFNRVRRSFAFANHPDRVPAKLRESAMLRMQEANRLIDEAKRRTLPREPL